MLSGIVRLVRPVQPSNEVWPIFVRLEPNEMLVRASLDSNAPLPRLVTGNPLMVSGITKAPVGLFVNPVMVIVPLLVVNVNCACNVMGKSKTAPRSQIRKRFTLAFMRQYFQSPHISKPRSNQIPLRSHFPFLASLKTTVNRFSIPKG